jgi:hypothetical protein
MKKPDNQSETNFTKIAEDSFALLERSEIEIEGFPKFYSMPLIAEEELQIAGFGMSDIGGMSKADTGKAVRKMAAFISVRAIDENGSRVFRNHSNQLAHESMAKTLSFLTLSTIIVQMQGPTDEIEDVAGKSEELDSGS